ncbi:hypothetical protein [Bradyrhizobium yuanmingense]|uniref:hypothetical protein n=1 Tax=Bradyrhizobium yuanmingense TaxID=108015 RepID=UPI0004BC3B69|nr:hypothetical protein [Bradyrhizobium yuanmingense]
MTAAINTSFIASSIASALVQAVRDKTTPKVGIDEITGAVIGYMAASHLQPSRLQFANVVEATLRKVVEKVG